MQVSQLYNLKPKFHLKALTFLRDEGSFRPTVNCTLHRLKATNETELESEEEQSGAGPAEGEGQGGASAPPPPHFFGNFKELLRKRCFQPPPSPPPHFESLVSPPLSEVAPRAQWRGERGDRQECRLTKSFKNTLHRREAMNQCIN